MGQYCILKFSRFGNTLLLRIISYMFAVMEVIIVSTVSLACRNGLDNKATTLEERDCLPFLSVIQFN